MSFKKFIHQFSLLRFSWSECGKVQARKNSVIGHFSHSSTNTPFAGNVCVCCVCVCVCVCVCFLPPEILLLTEQNKICNARDQASDVVLRKWFCVKCLRCLVIDNHSRDLQASNCGRVSIKPGRATRSKRQLLKLYKNQRLKREP